METKTEVLMIKLFNTLNQILLVHCFLMMMFADFFRTETVANYIYQEGDDDEHSLMDRADSLSSLLPLLTVLPWASLVLLWEEDEPWVYNNECLTNRYY